MNPIIKYIRVLDQMIHGKPAPEKDGTAAPGLDKWIKDTDWKPDGKS